MMRTKAEEEALMMLYLNDFEKVHEILPRTYDGINLIKYVGDDKGFTCPQITRH